MNLRMIIPEKEISGAFDAITAAGSRRKISGFAPTVENLFNDLVRSAQIGISGILE